ncbi:hypothetical protein BDV27DRAFT_134078 [Aspergillus caelatus]|uniref:6-methylsalicylate decarboxylase n=1 Tax=Aspergillus caelatus TaxID=61420 RepID=A0A5N6ZUU9_9EURO|nr:uncharacterized protein BDV27DRAFT_134078 [Aspergillus caelatus]KAE8360696.1 hypothetical protein BDV27DRAFT_134078 [Aspergillus caelatus]
MARRIDVHHHYIPPVYLQALDKTGGDPSGWPTPAWSLDADQKICHDCGIETAILSVTAPGAGILKGAESARLARGCNEFGRDLREKYPKNYGFFAALPDILDTEAALEEIRYAFDELQADGVTLFTRYGNGNYYLGHPAIQPIWEELDRRAAVVFVHPTHPIDTNLVNKMLPQPMIDYPHETTRTAVDLITTDTVRKYSHCKIILSHGGGNLPYLARRPAIMLKDLGLSDMTPEHFIENARMFYFDLALTDSSFALPLLEKFALPDHILFGSDFPYAPEATVRRFSKELDEAKLSKQDAENIDRGNALKLFPRLSCL